MIAQTVTNSFLEQLFLGVHDFATDTFKSALYTGAATLDQDTTVYITSNEVVGTGYTAGGVVLSGTTVAQANGVSYVDFADAVWSPAAFTARAALIYNASKGNKAVAVLDFGSDKTATTTFTVQMPANTSSAALLRIRKGV